MPVNATSPQASTPPEASVTSTTIRRRRADVILHDDGKQFTHRQHREVLLLLSYLCILHFQMPYNFGQAVFIVLSVFRHFLFIVSYPESFDFHVSKSLLHIFTHSWSNDLG